MYNQCMNKNSTIKNECLLLSSKTPLVLLTLSGYFKLNISSIFV